MGNKFGFIVDLDNTLFSSAKKTTGDAVGVCVGQSGEMSGYMSKTQAALWDWINSSGEVCVITARNYESFSRVRLPFGRFCAVDFGARLFENGKEDAAWREESLSMASSCSELVGGCWRRAVAMWAETTKNPSKLKTAVEQIKGKPVYWVAKYHQGFAEELDALEGCLNYAASELAGAVCVHRNGNNLVLCGQWLDKQRAAERMAEELRRSGCVVVGIGDSASDWNFVRACDFGMFPGGSQIGNSKLSGA